MEEINQGVLFVIFGGTGDLANRKLLPAAYNLRNQKEVEGDFQVLSLGRRDWTREDYHKEIEPWIRSFAKYEVDVENLKAFNEHVDYYKMDILDEAQYPAFFTYLEERYPSAKKMFYFAVSPSMFVPIAKGLSQNDWKPEEDIKVIIEKPFGETLAHAKQLYGEISTVFGEDHIYLIDHYLGKEMIQNISTLRFENMIFRASWNRQAIERVEISATETVGVETRGSYYDTVGATRDMVQNHLFQILSILAMEEPEHSSPFAVTVAQQNLLQALRPVEREDVREHLVMGQYRGYREEPEVDLQSTTETYAEMKLYIDNERWRGVPFVIKTGKKLDEKRTNVVVTFKETSKRSTANELTIQIQPDEGVVLCFNIKQPGVSQEVMRVHMDFCQSCMVEHANTPEAYQRLIKAAIDGERYLFSQWPQIEFSWRWVDQLLQYWEEEGKPLEFYEVGSKGPERRTT